jgi:hypothetical protein
MKLHASVIEKLLQIYTNFGGFQDERKLKEQLLKLDLTPYERKTTQNQEVILVDTDEYMKMLNNNQ